MKGLTVILAAAGATLAGAAIALLYAPRKGAETRRQIKDYVKTHCPSGICGEEGVLEEKLEKLEKNLTK